MASTVAASEAPPEPGTRRPRFGRATRLQADRRLGYAMVAPAVIILLFITAYPLVYNVWNSFHHVNLSIPGPHRFAGISNYRDLFTTPGFVASLTRTVGFTVVSVAFETVVSLGLALMLNHRFRGRGVLRAAILIPWAVPTVVSATLWTTMFDPRSGFVDYLLGIFHLPGAHITWVAGKWTAWTMVIVADAWKNVPFMAIILLAGLQVIPQDIYEAARIDGANAWQTFRSLTLPLLKPALLVALIFRTLQAFLIFDVIYIMTGGAPGTSTETLSYLNWQAFITSSNFGYGGAMSVLLVLMSLAIAGIYVRVVRPST
ncbi:MAG: sugar ABC transporter permease [Acidimicrobiales bacterium]|nr:sugar ABC transporter permease [Acidimicrobiales bacterium]MBO0893218.1 sugar ABC transporter permease [Acidimicrobiales bacterium]